MDSKKTHDDQKYIDALIDNDQILIGEIYKKFVPKVIGFVRKNSGDESAARDLVQEVLIILYDQAKTKDLKLTCPFDAYFFLICKRKWYNILKKRKYNEVTIEEDRLSISDDADEQVVASQKFEKKRDLFLSQLSEMGETCQKLIKLSMTKMSMKEIAEKLDITYGYARKKKSVCMSKLTAMIKNSAAYKAL